MAESLWRLPRRRAAPGAFDRRSPRDGREFVAESPPKPDDTAKQAAVPAMAESLWRVNPLSYKLACGGRSPRDGREFVAVRIVALAVRHILGPQSPRWQRVCGGHPRRGHPRRRHRRSPRDGREFVAVSAQPSSGFFDLRPQSPRWQRVCGGLPSVVSGGLRVSRSPRDGREFVAALVAPVEVRREVAAVPAMAESLWRTYSFGPRPARPYRRSPRDGREFVAGQPFDHSLHQLRRSPRDGREFVAAEPDGKSWAAQKAAVPAMAESLWRRQDYEQCHAGAMPQSPRWQRVCGGVRTMSNAPPGRRRSPRDGREFVAETYTMTVENAEQAAVPAMAESLWRQNARSRGELVEIAAVPAMAESLWRVTRR